ncbi:hypothetical protein COT99_00940 [Candidatus Falkowbacteria bacterium CG10_big_fil_rev_8_21_14_0_10_43_10]|uniref:CxxC-x17-CxxC domain-containing protein n=1 Tax=Candidatus Falkowbacteria bacterium CG10_big_fil_rev_8_21_14_0_10_43_10 TaxID=1974567 RepID=A0A2H0V4M2_9BACT|nr:MAG: hypothetical protein COT99_00940 [Candidatus Falkowbacteria bacterium CG10_big_fil_rev_8_21_14_0_10_43_10]
MDNRNSSGDRQMYQGSWSCSECGAAITELPFEPNGTSPLYCRDCHRKQRESRRPTSRSFGERKMYRGNWSCSSCGNSITELPFEPKDESMLLCKDCYRSQKNR